MSNNFERMMTVVNDTFDTRNDPDQISVDEEQRERMAQIHPATLSELANEDGPIVWILMIPTTTSIMDRFVNGTISEKQLLFETQPGTDYDTIYLCSASVLPEFRNKGLAKKVTLEAIEKIRESHAIKALCYWPFSEEGELLAMSVAKDLDLPLFMPFKDTSVPSGSVLVVESSITVSDMFVIALLGSDIMLPLDTILSSTNDRKWTVKSQETFKWQDSSSNLKDSSSNLSGKRISFYTVKAIAHNERPKVGETLGVSTNE